MRAAIVENGVVANIIMVDELEEGMYDGEGLAMGDVLDEVDGIFVRPSNFDLAVASAALVRQIDVDADAIYSAVMGNRTTEYTMAEQDAQAFKEAGYVGDAPASVQCWAEVKLQTPQWAADDILATAAAWRGAQAAIRANRLARKEDARIATDQAAIEAVAAAWVAFLVTIRTQLGLA